MRHRQICVVVCTGCLGLLLLVACGGERPPTGPDGEAPKTPGFQLAANGLLALDSFTNRTGFGRPDLTRHAPDVGFGGWTYNHDGQAPVPGDVFLEFDDRAANFARGPLRSRSTSDVANDDFRAWIWARSSGVTQTGQGVGLRFRVDRRPDPNTENEGVDVYLRRVSFTNMQLILEQRVTDPATGVQTVFDTIFTDTVFMPRSHGRRLGVDVRGQEVTVWTAENNDADPVHVNRVDYGPYTLKVDTRDDDHQRMGNRWQSVLRIRDSDRMWVMHFQVESFEPPPPPEVSVTLTTIRENRRPSGLTAGCQVGGAGDFHISGQATFPNGVPAAGLPFVLSSTFVPGSGGHAHQAAERPGFGVFDQASGVTDGNGMFQVKYAPGPIGGLEDFRVTVEGPIGPGTAEKRVRIGPTDPFVELSDDALIDVQQGTPAHPRAAFIQSRVQNDLNLLADAYYRATGGVRMPVGDASLRFGGLFDLDGAFLQQDPDAGHRQHRCGLEVDVPVIPEVDRELVQAAARAQQIDIAFYSEDPATGTTHIAFDRILRSQFPVKWPDGDRLTAEAEVVAGSIDPATMEMELEYELRNLPGSEQTLRVFLLASSVTAELIPPALGWVTLGPQITTPSRRILRRAFFAAGPASEDVAPGNSRRGFRIRTRGALPTTTEFWAEGRYPAPRERPDEEGEILKARLVEANSFEGLTVGPLPPAARTAAEHLASLRGRTAQACILGWIDSAGVCDALLRTVQQASDALAAGQNRRAKARVNVFQRLLAAQRDVHVNGNAFWMLHLRAEVAKFLIP